MMATALHLGGTAPMNPIPFNVMLPACHDSMRGRDEPPAFVHRESGEVLFVKPGDPVAAKWFPGVALGKLLATVTACTSWLAIPKHIGPPSELAGFVREWWEGNGFSLDESRDASSHQGSSPST
jgi:hypothetical protein